MEDGQRMQRKEYKPWMTLVVWIGVPFKSVNIGVWWSGIGFCWPWPVRKAHNFTEHERMQWVWFLFSTRRMRLRLKSLAMWRMQLMPWRKTPKLLGPKDVAVGGQTGSWSVVVYTELKVTTVYPVPLRDILTTIRSQTMEAIFHKRMQLRKANIVITVILMR